MAEEVIVINGKQISAVANDVDEILNEAINSAILRWRDRVPEVAFQAALILVLHTRYLYQRGVAVDGLGINPASIDQLLASVRKEVVDGVPTMKAGGFGRPE